MTWRDRWKAIAPYAVPALVFLAIVLAMFWRLWTPISGARRTFGWDAQWEYWGDLQFQLDAYQHGHLPLWNPFDRGGYPFHADPQAGILYPITWLLLAIGALSGGAAWWLVAVKIALHFWIAGLGVYAFLRRRGVAVAACYAGGILFVFTYPFIHNLFSALNWSMAWAPWALLAIDMWAEAPSRRRGAIVALALGMGVLAGAMAAFWYTLLVVVPYGTWAIVHHARAAGPAGSAERRAYLRAAASTAGIAGALFVAMVAAQLGATSALVPHTVREARDYGFITDSAFGADDMMSFIIPHMPGENCYVGFMTMLWIVSALTIRPDPRKLVLAGSALLAILCAWGSNGNYLATLASALPPFGFFRRAHRYLYAMVLPVAILGAEGLSELAALEAAELRARVGRMAIGAGAIATLILGIGFVVKATDPQKIEPYRDAYALGFAAAAVGAWVTRQIVAKDGGMRRAFLWIATVAIALDLVIARAYVLDRNMYPIPDTSHDKEIAGLTGVPEGDVRMYDREYLKFRPGLRRHVRDLGGYEGDPLALRRYARLLEAISQTPSKAGHANVGWFLQAGTKALPAVAGDKTAFTQVRAGVFRVKDVAPRVLWIGKPIVVDGDEGAALTELMQHVPGTAAVLEKKTAHGLGEDPPSDAPPVAGAVTKSSLASLTAEIDAPAAGIVVIHEAFYPGWTATVDGTPAPIVPANVMFRGVAVGPGHHVIAMSYHATRWLLLAPVAILAMLLAAVIALRRPRGAAATT